MKTRFMKAGGIKIFVDSRWKKLYAPVIPPTQIIKEILEYKGEKPLRDDVGYWQNGTGKWIMLYLTEIEGNEIVTHLRIGSVQPVAGWLSDSSFGYEINLWRNLLPE